MAAITSGITSGRNHAVLDEAHVGDIRGALGTIAVGDYAPRATLSAKLKTLLAIVGPGLIVMVGDNDAGAFQTYGQAGQNYGTHLLWTLLLLVPVLYVNQEMVLRLGAVTGVGHARLILERFGKFWGAFSVIDLFILNALTIITEFIGITIAAGYLGVPKVVAVLLAAAVIIAAAFTGSFRRFERIAITFCAGSLLLIPLYFILHPAASSMARGFTIPALPGGNGGMATVMMLVIGIVGTTVAPWQLFFQQSYVIDKRITPRFIKYEKVDLWIGIVIVVVGAAALMGVTAAAFAGTKGFGNFTDSAGLAAGIAAHAGRVAGVIFAVALLDASIIGAFALSLSSAYAIGDVLGLNHSLHRGFGQAKGFYAVYAALIAGAAAIVLIPGSPLGLLTLGVQVLAGVLLPSATVFLLLLCNDKAVLGPWVNKRGTNMFTSTVVALLITLSVVLTASVLFPRITGGQIVDIMLACAGASVVAGAFLLARARRAAFPVPDPDTLADRDTWRMPPLNTLTTPLLSAGRKVGLSALRLYLAAAMILVIVKVVQVAIGH
ncbi:MAG TPA: NRAMP family divalent metal transporter [Streptosporangiaceae bacterium]|nr:NRAMP family divalent metal transporter [Streptosporangiaceae bacterium]